MKPSAIRWATCHATGQAVVVESRRRSQGAHFPQHRRWTGRYQQGLLTAQPRPGTRPSGVPAGKLALRYDPRRATWCGRHAGQPLCLARLKLKTPDTDCGDPPP